MLKTMQKCRSYGPDKLNLWPYYHLTFNCDLNLQPTLTNVSNGTSTPPGEQLCQLIIKSMYKCRSYVLDKLNFWPFYYLTFRCYMTSNNSPIWTNVSNGTTTPQEQLCQIILKTMHKCRTYGLDKLNLCPFYHLTFKCDLELQPTWTNISNGTSTPQGQKLCQFILKSMHNYRSHGLDKLNLWPIQVWPCLQPTWKNFQMALLSSRTTRIPRNAVSCMPALFHKIEVNLWTGCSSLYHLWETRA